MKRRINAITQLLDKILRFLLHGLERSGGEISPADEESANFFSQIAFQPNRKRKTLLISRTPDDHRTSSIWHDRALNTFCNTNNSKSNKGIVKRDLSQCLVLLRKTVVKGQRCELMSVALPVVYLARHGETAWTLSGQHTGLTDLPLTERGERNARRLEERLRGLSFAKVFTSPLQRARRTCELAGFGAVAEIDPDLVEWNYGEYEGRRTAEIRAERPDWELFRDGSPGGESPAQAAARADRVVSRVRAVPGDVLLFSSGHFIRVLATRWIGLEVTVNAKRFMLSTASLSAVGYENELSRRVIRLWNDTHHVGD